MIKEKLKMIVEERDLKYGRYFDLFIQCLIIFSLITFSIETLPNISGDLKTALIWCERFIILIFTLEYLLRIYVADKKLGFIFSFWGLIDLIAIAPFYLAFALDLRTVRILRFFRLFRLFKLLRYSKTIKRIGVAFGYAKEELILFSAVTLCLLYLAAVGIYYFEREAQPEVFASIFHSIWWAVTTLTTVGYGDSFPITVGGKIFTFFVLMIGLGIIAVPAGIVSSALTNARGKDNCSD